MSTPGAEATAAEVLELCARHGLTLAVAESLTGGLVAAALTSVPGASRSFRGSVTAYATDVKRDVLGVPGELLAERGAVDSDVARRMAAGVRWRLGADWGLATTGVAGPEPQDGQPVGTVFAAVAGPQGHARTVRLDLAGDRRTIREAAVSEALGLLSEELGKRISRALAGQEEGSGAQDTEQSGGDGCLQP
ncbi:CinA family protein [Streptomyces boninensis]|uniref:CinA family protein n=1 Tax=Streptomyces boninensis TaxID=2039455 RepID=UPI003B215681